MLSSVGVLRQMGISRADVDISSSHDRSFTNMHKLTLTGIKVAHGAHILQCVFLLQSGELHFFYKPPNRYAKLKRAGLVIVCHNFSLSDLFWRDRVF